MQKIHGKFKFQSTLSIIHTCDIKTQYQHIAGVNMENLHNFLTPYSHNLTRRRYVCASEDFCPNLSSFFTYSWICKIDDKMRSLCALRCGLMMHEKKINGDFDRSSRSFLRWKLVSKLSLTSWTKLCVIAINLILTFGIILSIFRVKILTWCNFTLIYFNKIRNWKFLFKIQ